MRTERKRFQSIHLSKHSFSFERHFPPVTPRQSTMESTASACLSLSLSLSPRCFDVIPPSLSLPAPSDESEGHTDFPPPTRPRRRFCFLTRSDSSTHALAHATSYRLEAFSPLHQSFFFHKISFSTIKGQMFLEEWITFLD